MIRNSCVLASTMVVGAMLAGADDSSPRTRAVHAMDRPTSRSTVSSGRGAEVYAEEIFDKATGALKPPPLVDEQRYGVSIMAPTYKPNGVLGPNILIEAAEDAYSLGFRTLKIAMNHQVVDELWKFYSLPDEVIGPIDETVEIAQLDVFRHVLSMPFKTYFITADAIGFGTWNDLAVPESPSNPHPTDAPLSPAAQKRIYKQLYDLSVYLLNEYQGTGKVFVLQNHETDWHLLRRLNPNVNPSNTAIANAIKYFQLRQQAVNDARLKVKAKGVYLYHLCEVNLVKKAMAGGKTVANNVLPYIACDLVGYSAWDLSAVDDGSFLAAVRYLQSKAKDSFAFGANNVAITEIGLPEKWRTNLHIELRHVLESMSIGCPWTLHWTLYDNECMDDDKVRVFDPTVDQCNGLWVRRPDGSFGFLYGGYRPYMQHGPTMVEPEDTESYVAEVYRSMMGREPDEEALASATAMIEESPWNKEALILGLVDSEEYRTRTDNSSAAFVYDCHRLIFGRNPDLNDTPQLALNYGSLQARAKRISEMLAEPDAQRRYIDWLSRRRYSRSLNAKELKYWLGRASSGLTRKQVYLEFMK